MYLSLILLSFPVAALLWWARVCYVPDPTYF